MIRVLVLLSMLLPLALTPGPEPLATVERVTLVQSVEGAALIAGKATVARIVLSGEPCHLVVQAWRGSVPIPGPIECKGDGAVDVLLPTSWVSGVLSLQVQAWVRNRVSVLWTKVTFAPAPRMDIVLVPIAYTRDTGHIRKTCAPPDVSRAADWLVRCWPVASVNVTVHAPVPFEGELGYNVQDWSRLLFTIRAAKTREGAPESQFWYGVLPFACTPYDYAGIGYIGGRVAAGVGPSSDTQTSWDNIGRTLAHELGHNLGLLHAGCCGAEALKSCVEPYPYEDCRIGVPGYDVGTMTEVSPDARDLMSYCRVKWLSDYNYQRIYRALMTPKAQAMGEPQIHIDRAEEMGLEPAEAGK